MTVDMINIKNITVSSNHKLLLSDVSLEVQESECVALLGPNGAGKSTLIDSLTGMIKPVEGTITMRGQSFRKMRNKIGVMYESVPLFYYLTVKEVVKYICTIHGINYESIKPIMESLDILKLERSQTQKLSKGEKKKVSVLLSLIHNPHLVILDEPTSDLDPFMRDIVWKIFKQNNRTILFTTHLWEEAQLYADRVAFISDGKILKTDATLSLLSPKYIPARTKVIIRKQEKFKAPLNGTFFIEEDDMYSFYPADTTKFLEKINAYAVEFTVAPVGLKDVFFYLKLKSPD